MTDSILSLPYARKTVVFTWLIAVAVLAVYANSLGNGFVWDDNVVITANPALQGDAQDLFAGIDAGRELDRTPYYRPLTLLTFLIENRIFGLTPLPLHILNVLLHAANAVLVYLLAGRLVEDRRAAFMAGLLFAVHPINAESVNFLSGGRNTLLAGLFSLSAYLLHLNAVSTKRFAPAAVGAASLLAALLSKETALGILPFIAALELSALRGAGRGDGIRSAVRSINVVVFTTVYFILRETALSDAGVGLTVLSGLGDRLLANGYIIPRYLLSFLWPPASSPQYVVPEDLHLLALPLAAAWAGIIAATAWLLTKGRRPATVFGLLWCAVFYLPASGIVAIPSAPLADRYLYLPAIGLWIVIADQAARLLSLRGPVPRYAAAIAGLVLLMLAGATVASNQQWKSDIALFSRYVERYPDRAFGHHNLGCAYLDKARDLDAAEREFRKAIDLDPFFPRVWTQLGYVSLLRGNYEGAIRNYDEALLQNPFDAEALLNRASAYDQRGKNREALMDYQRFLATPNGELPLARPRVQARVRELLR